MIRFAQAILTFALAVTSASAAVIVPPVPRFPVEVFEPKGDSPTESKKPTDPAAIVERITKNAKNAVDRLAANDPGTDTRKTQEQILRDLDALLNQAQNPPSGGGGGGSDSDSKGGGGQPPPDGGSKNPSGGKGGESKESGNGPSGPGSPGQNKPSESGGSSGSPKSGPSQGGNSSGNGTASKSPSGPSGSDWRQGAKNNRSKEVGDKPEGTASGELTKPGPGTATGGTVGGTFAGTGGKSEPTLKPDEVLAKQAWGHLPERLRREMSQYYREQFQSRYGDLLKQYYSSLAEKEKAGK